MTSNASDQSTSSAVSWISWCCSLPGHEYFIQVPEAFIEDDFNLINLAAIIPNYNQALDLILDLESDEPLPVDLETNAISLYGLIHARYITTKLGLQAYRSRVLNNEFGVCPRYEICIFVVVPSNESNTRLNSIKFVDKSLQTTNVLGCHSAPLIPTGLSDTPLLHSVKLYCHKCLDIYTPKQTRYLTTDGSAFGTTFANLFHNTYPDIITQSDYSTYYPRIFGFKVSIKSPVGPTMAYLRKRIVDCEEMVVDLDDGSMSDGA